MTWTYSGDPSASDLNAVRYYIADTDAADPLLNDEEINFELTQHDNALDAALSCCSALAAKFARQVDYVIGPEAVKASQRSTQYKNLYEVLQKKKFDLIKGSIKAAPVGAPTEVYGTPIFSIGMFDNTGGEE